MIVDVYGENKRKGRKKKITVDIKKKEEVKDEVKSPCICKNTANRIEKYGIIGYEKIVDIFENIIKNGNIPNFTIYGKTGSGKTYLVDWLLMNLFKNHYKERVLTMNLHDERGIATIRDKIKGFSNIQVKEYKEIPSLKVIVFDQAEYLSVDAQNALRRIIEVSNNLTRFIFITRNTRCIIDPILSRCLKLHLSTECQIGRVEKYKTLFPDVSDKDILTICKNNNFGIEINWLESNTICNKEDKTEEIVELLKCKNTTLQQLMEYCNNIDGNRIYNKIKDVKIAKTLVEYELFQKNMGSIHCLNLLSQLHSILN